MYKVVFTQRVVKYLENIDEQMRNGIAVKLREYAKEAQRYARNVRRNCPNFKRKINTPCAFYGV